MTPVQLFEGSRAPGKSLRLRAQEVKRILMGGYVMLQPGRHRMVFDPIDFTKIKYNPKQRWIIDEFCGVDWSYPIGYAVVTRMRHNRISLEEYDEPNQNVALRAGQQPRRDRSWRSPLAVQLRARELRLYVRGADIHALLRGARA